MVWPILRTYMYKRLTRNRLYTHCRTFAGSVPRGRVFASYSTTCGNELVPPLNAASFGKLVRIVFPNITTRRLGVRGESKYHYVELTLVNEDRGPEASLSQREKSG